MIFEPIVKKDFEWINAIRDEDYEVFLKLDGTSVLKNWVPVKVRRVAADKRQKAKESDFPWLGSHALILRQKAVSALNDILIRNGELLPLIDETGIELFVFNANVVDALDLSKSSVLKFPYTDRIMRVMKYAFLPDRIAEKDIFRLPFRSSPTFVSERFIEVYKAQGLVGLEFEERPKA